MADRDSRHRSLSAAGMGAEAAAALVREVLSARGDLHVQEVAPGRMIVTRTRRPRWAVVLCACTVWIGGLGLLFLLVKQTEAGEIVVTEGPRGSVVTVPPLLAGGSADALAAALRGPVAPSSTDRPLAAVAAGPAQGDDLEDRTVARRTTPVPAAAPTAAPPIVVPEARLRFAAGAVTLAAGQSLVLGREPGAGPAPGRVVPGDASTVSKAHLLVRFDGRALTVEDLGSTNGSTVTRAGATHLLEPGVPVAVAPGDQVALGALECLVEIPPTVAP